MSLRGRTVKVSEYQSNFLILDDLGKVYSVGQSNQYGILGRGFENNERVNSSRQPASGHIDQIDQVYSLDPEFIIDIVISKNHCLALNNRGQAFSWGFALHGALGYELLNLEACQLWPKQVEIDGNVVKIAASEQNSAFITEDGSLYICGQN